MVVPNREKKQAWKDHMDAADYRALTARQRSAANAFQQGAATREQADVVLRALGLRGIPEKVSTKVGIGMVGVTCRRLVNGRDARRRRRPPQPAPAPEPAPAPAPGPPAAHPEAHVAPAPQPAPGHGPFVPQPHSAHRVSTSYRDYSQNGNREEMTGNGSHVAVTNNSNHVARPGARADS